MSEDFSKLCKVYLNIREKIAEHKDHLAHLEDGKRVYEASMRAAALELLANGESPIRVINGYRIAIGDTETFNVKVADDKLDDIVGWLGNNGVTVIPKTSVHWKTLQSAVSEVIRNLEADGDGYELPDGLTATPFYPITVTKQGK